MATHTSMLAWRIPVNRGAWQAAVHRVEKSWTQLSNYSQGTETSYLDPRLLIKILCSMYYC